jgi:hypothetical protein
VLLSGVANLTYLVAKNLDLTLGQGFARQKNIDLFVEISNLMQVNYGSTFSHFLFKTKVTIDQFE